MTNCYELGKAAMVQLSVKEVRPKSRLPRRKGYDRLLGLAFNVQDDSITPLITSPRMLQQKGYVKDKDKVLTTCIPVVA